jgi:hypothetical protein
MGITKTIIQKILIEETEKVDNKIFNFLVRRSKKETKKLGGDWGDLDPIIVTEYTFEGFPEYGFNNFISKKNVESKILELLFHANLIDDDIFMRGTEMNEKHQTTMKTIRAFLKYINFK